jgi:hypothetical protein
LDGHIERGRRLIGDQKVRVPGQGERNRDALSHAAGELVRSGATNTLWFRELNEPEQFKRAVLGCCARHPLVMSNGFNELASDCEGRVQARLRVLGYVGELGAAKIVELALGHTKDVATSPDDATPGRLERIGEEAEESKRSYALAAAGLANQPHRFSMENVKTDSVDDWGAAAPVA